MTIRPSLLLFIHLSILAHGQDDKVLAYQLITDIRKEFKIKFLNDSSITFPQNDSPNHFDFIKKCSNYITSQELEILLKDQPRRIQWEQCQLKKITCVNPYSVQNINLGRKSKKWKYIHSISTPLFDKTRKYALVRISSQLPDPEGTNIYYGGECSYLFCYRDKKWTRIYHDDCVDY